MSDLPEGVAALAAALSSGEWTAASATRAYLERIAARNPQLNAFLQVAGEQAQREAHAADLRRARSQWLSALDGIPIGVKDNIDVAGMATTGGIGHYRGQIAQEDASVIAQLKRAGAVVLGKLNMHEAALGATNDNPWFGRCENPLRAGFTPGGSSGGSAAAVAAGLCAAALGTDTLGSVRIPASYCGVAALKPTYGLVDTRGVMPLSPTLDHVGFIAPCVADLALLLEAALSAERAFRAAALDAVSLRGLRVGRLRESADTALTFETRQGYKEALRAVRDAGALVSDAALADYDFGRMRREGLLVCEMEGGLHHAAALQRDSAGFSPELRALFAFGAGQSTSRLAQAHERLAQGREAARRMFASIDVLLLPTTPQPAFAFGAPAPVDQADFTAFANIAGVPAVCVPWGVSADGLPLSVQFVAPWSREDIALAAAAALERQR
jgi:aspartyl-tRNA(Asn)/glutamyl-tRNA(Gln) amidotransferase subunit A